MINVTIDLFNINELSKEAKENAIAEHKDFLLSIFHTSDYDKSFNMTYKKYAAQLTKKDILEDMEINDYLFFSDGTLAQTCRYTGKHVNSGKHIFTFKGVDYDLNGKGLLIKSDSK